jgi:16S rRNA (cytosine967-C5)-methyltransferase
VSATSAARRAAYEVVRRTFEHDAWTDAALRSAAERHGLEGRDRALAQRLAYGAAQRRGTSDALISRLAGRPAEHLDAPVLAALRIGLYELLFSGSEAHHAAVGEAVELAKGGMRVAGDARKADAAAGLVNAVLRRAARDRDAILRSLGDATPADAAVAHSMPAWIARMWWEELGAERARALMAASNEPVGRALRVNTLRGAPEALVEELKAAGERVAGARGTFPDPLAPPEAVVSRGRWGERLRGAIADGALVPQSLASQAVVALLDPRPGERVLDLCAGPGVKSTQIAARMEDRGDVRSVEIDAGRASRIEGLCRRLGVTSVSVEVADASRGASEAPGAPPGPGYDRVLVDPPCTDLGALASRPDARWRKSPAQRDRLARLQAAVLRRGVRSLRRGGTLVYATCTVSRRESEEIVVSALEDEPGLEADDLGASHRELASPHDGRFLQTRPDRDRTEGFFIARLRRVEA